MSGKAQQGTKICKKNLTKHTPCRTLSTYITINLKKWQGRILSVRLKILAAGKFAVSSLTGHANQHKGDQY